MGYARGFCPNWADDGQTAYRERARTITSSVDRHNHRLDDDYYTQPLNLFRLMTPDARERLVDNIVASMKTVPQRIQEKQVQHFYKADPKYGEGVAQGLGLKKDPPAIIPPSRN